MLRRMFVHKGWITLMVGLVVVLLACALAVSSPSVSFVHALAVVAKIFVVLLMVLFGVALVVGGIGSIAEDTEEDVHVWKDSRW